MTDERTTGGGKDHRKACFQPGYGPRGEKKEGTRKEGAHAVAYRLNRALPERYMPEQGKKGRKRNE